MARFLMEEKNINKNKAHLIVEAAEGANVAREALNVALVVGVSEELNTHARAGAEGGDLVVAAQSGEARGIGRDLPDLAAVLAVSVEPDLMVAGA